MHAVRAAALLLLLLLLVWVGHVEVANCWLVNLVEARSTGGGLDDLQESCGARSKERAWTGCSSISGMEVEWRGMQRMDTADKVHATLLQWH